jgi:hypothetical protein
VASRLRGLKALKWNELEAPDKSRYSFLST